jgi:hypothetical protein
MFFWGRCYAQGLVLLAFKALRIGHHFSISALCHAASASGVCCSLEKVQRRIPQVEITLPDRPMHRL